MPLIFFELTDYNDPVPRVKMDLPLLRIGDKIDLRFKLERLHAGRRELLQVDGEYQVLSIKYTSMGGVRARAQIISTGVAPAWRAIRHQAPRKLAPARSRTEIT